MTPFLLYIARAGLYLSLFYAFYLLAMRRTTFFRLNRGLLLSLSYLCLLLPLIKVRTVSAFVGGATKLTMVKRHSFHLSGIGLEDAPDNQKRELH